jgi:hypothetical protein
MGQFVDNLLAYRVLRLLTTPFEDTDAFKLGIIDAKGKELKPMSALNTVVEREAYTLLHRLVFRLKKIIEKIPIENKRLLSLAAAYSLIRENFDKKYEPVDLENQFVEKLSENLNEEIELVETYFNNRKMFTFKQYHEEMGGVPANNAAATPGIATPDPPRLFGKKVIKRKKNV